MLKMRLFGPFGVFDMDVKYGKYGMKLLIYYESYFNEVKCQNVVLDVENVLIWSLVLGCITLISNHIYHKVSIPNHQSCSRWSLGVDT